MSRIFRFSLVSICAFLLISALSFFYSPETRTNTVNTLVTTTLPSEYPAGAVLMIGHWADTPVASTTELITQYQPGGVIIMSAPENPATIKDWVTTWQTASTWPLIIAIDQEGGEVTRVHGDGFTDTPQRSVTTESEAYALGLQRGAELASLDINMNFAPVLDTATSVDSFLYHRVFANPEAAPMLAAAMTQGMADSGVIAAAKHFPGHPNSADDSHFVLPEVTITENELTDFTKPFSEYISLTTAKALMTAHVSFPKIDPKPATLSHFFLSDYLRNTLNFTGLIITDDISMDAIINTRTAPEAAMESLLAGADMVLLAAEPHLISEIEPAIQARMLTDSHFAHQLTRAQHNTYKLQQELPLLDEE